MSSTTKRRLSFTVIFIIILAVFSVMADWHASPMEEGGNESKVPSSIPLADFWNKFDYHLGLDLKGGTHLVYQADTSQLEARDKDSAVEGVRDVIERRVNAFGVSEPIVQTNQADGQYRIIVELAGVKDVNQAINMIGETPLLEFKEQNPEYAENIVLTDEQQAELDKYNQDAQKLAQEINSRALKGEDFASLAAEYSEDPGSKDKGGDLGWANPGAFVPEFDTALFKDLKPGQITSQPVKTQFGYHIIKKIEERTANADVQAFAVNAVNAEGEPVNIDGGLLESEENNKQSNIEVLSSHILIKTKTPEDIVPLADQWKNTELSGKHLKRASVQYDQNTGDPEVSLEFNSEGADLFEQITGRNVDKPVAIFLDDFPISAPNVNEKITGGKAVITGRFNLQEAKELVQRLNAGALPVPINLISQQTVGPSLGHASVDKSLTAGLIGLALIALFMILYYRLPGLLSVIALAIYTIVVIMLFRIIPVTLTLAGVAGFILSIGIAVDANVLIFERLKEEIKSGRNFSTAVEEGFKRAWTSIRDSNISSLITCAILIWFGTSIIKGFAITLTIGILVSMFSAITITRSFLRMLNGGKMDKYKWLIGKSS
ncbi:MAG: protein translocase subunit SecD [Candidatus Kuenenbacteria bacterium]